MIFWSLRARRRIEQALAATPDEVRLTMTQIECLLRCVFPGANVNIVVQDQYAGYRPNPDQFVLLVEVETGPQEDRWVRPQVVKFNLEENSTALQDEWNAWTLCRPHGLEHDIVLMTLQPRCRPETQEVFALVYGDAQQFIGVPRITSLEEAATDAVLYGSPSVASVRNTLFQLYERLGQLLYAYSYDEPIEPAYETRLPTQPEMAVYLQVWRDGQHPRVHPAREAIQRIPYPPGFIPPVRFLESLPQLVQQYGACHPTTGHPWIPTSRLGRAHGDLHGRNILVGITNDDQVVWPAVFDFESMARNNPLAMDFIKLETELKIRILPLILCESDSTEYFGRIQGFEQALLRWTYHCRLGIGWPVSHDDAPSWHPPQHRAIGSGEAPEEGEGLPDIPLLARAVPLEQQLQLRRLLAVLLEIRHRAAIQLGERSGRPDSWFHQYLYWQLCYGLRGITFPNLSTIQLTAAYISAGVAAAALNARYPDPDDLP